MNSDLILYYKDRAKEYEKIYAKPERQEELSLVERELQSIFKNKEVLEVACGTGYWTQKIASVAQSVLATDINEAVIEIARSKGYERASAQFEVADLYDLKEKGEYESLFGGFIWSHIHLQELDKFIYHCNSLVRPGGTVVFIDNNYVEGSSSPVVETDQFGNTYQNRKLENGTNHKVLKNFPTLMVIQRLLADVAVDLQFKNLNYYWILKYKIQ